MATPREPRRAWNARTAAKRKADQRERDRRAIWDSPEGIGYATTEGLLLAISRGYSEKLPYLLVEVGRRFGIHVTTSILPTAPLLKQAR